MTSQSWAKERVALIHDDWTSNNISYYGGEFDMVPERGTAHLSVIAPNGDAVAVTSTINQSFGSGVMSPSTGIIFNDQVTPLGPSALTPRWMTSPSPTC